MADNVTLPGTGSVVGTDDVGGVQYQQVKLVDGTLDSSTPIGTDTNPLRTGGPDCITLLSSTLTTAGVTATLDTAGFGAVVTQISGVWSGSLTFEQSNGNDAWDTVLVYSRDSVAIQDIITSNGLYTLRPSGRYLRLNVARITGSMVVNSIGRDDAGDSAVDALTLAMDRNNSVPLNVQLNGVKQDTQGALIPSDGFGPYIKVLTNTTDYFVVDTLGYPSLALQVSGGAGTVIAECSNDGGSWYGPLGAYVLSSSNGSSWTGTTQSFTATNPLFEVIPASYGRYVRFRLSIYTSGTPTLLAYLRNSSPPTALSIQPVSGTITANIASTTTVATTNSQTLDTNIITATAAAVRQIKASAGRITMLQLSNGAANVAYLHLQNNAAAATTTAAAMTFAVPATAGTNINIALPEGGLFMSAGIAYTVSGAIASGDVTALTAPSLAVNISYI